MHSEIPVSGNEMKDEFFLGKPSKSLGYDNNDFNVIKKCVRTLCKSLTHNSNLSLKFYYSKWQYTFRKTSHWKWNKRCIFPTKTNKSVGYDNKDFLHGRLTDHAIIQLDDQINNNFKIKVICTGCIYWPLRSI